MRGSPLFGIACSPVSGTVYSRDGKYPHFSIRPLILRLPPLCRVCFLSCSTIFYSEKSKFGSHELNFLTSSAATCSGSGSRNLLVQLLLLCLLYTLSLVSWVPTPPGCPTNSACTPTMTCGGLCVPTPTSIPPPQTCVMGDDTCQPASTCTPTASCAPYSSCGGLCIANPASTFQTPCTVGAPSQCPTGATCTPAGASGVCVTTPGPLPTMPCVLGGNKCPTGSTCTQTEACSGLCFPTAPPQIPCAVHGRGPSHCPSHSTCTPTMTCEPHRYCGGLCIAAATVTPL